MARRDLLRRRHPDGRRAAPREPIRWVGGISCLPRLYDPRHSPTGFREGLRRSDGALCGSGLSAPTSLAMPPGSPPAMTVTLEITNAPPLGGDYYTTLTGFFSS